MTVFPHRFPPVASLFEGELAHVELRDGETWAANFSRRETDSENRDSGVKVILYVYIYTTT